MNDKQRQIQEKCIDFAVRVDKLRYNDGKEKDEGMMKSPRICLHMRDFLFLMWDRTKSQKDCYC